jgi:hypothetical protein
MQERNQNAGDGESEEGQVNQVDALARNMVRLFDQSAKVFFNLAERTQVNGKGPYSIASEASEAA